MLLLLNYISEISKLRPTNIDFVNRQITQEDETLKFLRYNYPGKVSTLHLINTKDVVLEKHGTFLSKTYIDYNALYAYVTCRIYNIAQQIFTLIN